MDIEGKPWIWEIANDILGGEARKWIQKRWKLDDKDLHEVIVCIHQLMRQEMEGDEDIDLPYIIEEKKIG